MTTRPFLLPEDVARIWSEEAGRPIKKETVRSYREKSKPTGRYAKNPVPKQDGYTGEGGPGNSRPYWLPNREEELRVWWHSRPGPGRPRKDDAEPTVYTTVAELAKENADLAAAVRRRLERSRANRPDQPPTHHHPRGGHEPS